MRHTHKKTSSITKKILLRLVQKIRCFLNYLRRITYNPSLKESILELLAEHDSNAKNHISPAEKNILYNILSFENLCVHDLMTPRADIIAVSHQITLNLLKNTIIKDKHTRMPVYQDSLDKIIGFIHVKDILSEILTQKDEDFVIAKIIRKILVAPPSMKAVDLLAKMRASRMHIAIVLDEYGGVDGLVTIENLIEAIIGEIEDEHDTVQVQDYVVLRNSTIEASARLHIKKLEQLFQITLSHKEENDFDTVGGLILSLINHVPSVGEVIKHHSGLVFKILDADPRRIKKIYISKSETKPTVNVRH